MMPRSSFYGRTSPAYGAGFAAVEPLQTRGFRDGPHSWIDVRPKNGPVMRITHSIGADVSRPPTFNGLEDLELLPAVPLAVYGLAAAAAAGALLSAWIMAQDDDWNSPEYFDQAMHWLHATLLAWDKESWVDDRCLWKTTHAPERSQWVEFLKTFGQFYTEVGQTRASFTAWTGAGVRDRYIPAAKSFMRQLNDVWVPFFQTKCGFSPVGSTGIPRTSSENTENTPDWGKVAMWGALGLGAIALASVVRTLR